MRRSGLLFSVLLAACASSGDSVATSPARVPVGVLWTRWGAALAALGRDPGSGVVHPQYPRPTLVRERWLNLNGAWRFEPGAERQPVPVGRDLSGTILVPFPVESALSGVGAHHERLWLERTFTMPDGWRGDRVLLHFGAVDWEAEVWVNGKPVGEHRGGYEPFSFDVTDALLPVPQQEILVRVWDPTDAGDQPRGKQSLDPKGIWYTPVTGIWQTVWLEPVAPRGIEDIDVEPDLPGGGVAVTVQGEDLVGTDVVEVEVLERGGLLAARRGTVGERLFVPIPAPRAWSPNDPFLYDLRVTRSAADGRVRDRVTSYFGLRTIALRAGDDGIARLVLNGEPLYQTGVLDQGYWPDGLYTAPSSEAMRHDLATVKALGFNMVRKHVKVEPASWYAWCDRLGLLVWQDVPNGNNATPAGRAQFERELEGILAALHDHPSVVLWVLFNEGWGQFDTARLTARVRELDPTRLVTNASGWTDAGVGDVLDAHNYPGPIRPTVSAERAAVLGEFGGLGLRVDGHSWTTQTWGYRGVTDSEDLAFGYEAFARELVRLRAGGLAASVYTQLTDVESECNGLMTYDREVLKVGAERIARANRGELPTIATVFPTSETGGRPWRYRLDPPSAGWQDAHAGFDAPGLEEGWTEGVGGFGTEGTPRTFVGTPWNTPEIWMRHDFRLTAPPTGELIVRLHHDEDVEVWVNGTLVLTRTGFATTYQSLRTGLRAEDVLRQGVNRIAVHCEQTEGGQYVDVGLEIVEK